MTTGADSPLNADQLSCDVAIVGGGVAGLWLLNLLSQRGYNVLLFEAEALGNAQSIASQGSHRPYARPLAQLLAGQRRPRSVGRLGRRPQVPHVVRRQTWQAGQLLCQPRPARAGRYP